MRTCKDQLGCLPACLTFSVGIAQHLLMAALGRPACCRRGSLTGGGAGGGAKGAALAAEAAEAAEEAALAAAGLQASFVVAANLLTCTLRWSALV